jgi:hypothetical protein
MLVRVVKNFNFPDIMRQTPHGEGIWDDIQFTCEKVEVCDYLVILNHHTEDITVRCPHQNLWAIMMEPPIETFRWHLAGLKEIGRIYTPDVTLRGPRFIYSHGALPWHVGKSYDDLMCASPPDKPRRLSWITSNINSFEGHRERMRFLEEIRGKIEFDLWGRGFTFIQDKWDGLAPYRYALAIENYSGPYYWTEKVADCFLSWTMPIYYGCTNLADYFPAESFVQIDIHTPDVADQINEIIHSERWRQQRDAIAHARELVLNQHQLFPFVTKLIRQAEQQHAVEAGAPPRMRLKSVSYKSTLPPLRRLKHFARRLITQYIHSRRAN